MNVAGMLFSLLDRRERVRLVVLAGAMVIMGIVEMAGVASILPFMQLLADPGVLEGSGFVATVFDRLGFASVESALFAAGVFLLLMIAFNNVFNAFTAWFIYRFAWSLNHRLSTRLLSRYLHQPYPFFLDRNTADLNRTLLGEVNSVVTGVVLPLLQVAVRSIAATLIIALLAIVDWRLAVLMAVVFGGAYGGIYALFRRSQHRLGWAKFNFNGERFKIAGEALSGIKDVKALAREREFIRRFAAPSRGFSRASAHNQIVARMPRYALEVIGFGGILVIVLYYLRSEADMAQVLPLLSLYAFAGYRLMPALNELFSSVVTIRFNTAALTELHRELVLDDSSEPRSVDDDGTERWADDGAPGDRSASGGPAAAEFAGIAFKSVSFRYPGAGADTLRELDLEIPPRQTVGFIGATGAGKTTLVDLVLGLLRPTVGTISVDGEELGEENARRWRRRCGYVPQDVFLADDSVRANIALGIPEAEIDGDEVERAAHVAQIHDFVASLDDGFETVIGERGVRMSGGQRQRIGIARALYHDPDVLILDEATSALDGATESAVIETISTIGDRKTILVIAHRLTTVQACDVIHLIEEGRIVASGPFEELSRDARFQALAGELQD